MSIEYWLLLIAVIMLLSALPLWPYSRQWGYTPMGVLGIILIALILWTIAGNRRTTTVGEDIRDGMEDAAHEVKDLGQDVKHSVRDMVK